MLVSKQFLKDFAYLANRYEWTPDEIEDIKAHTRAYPVEMRRYWTNLATAYRAGYEQTVANDYIRLQTWCAQQSWPDPYADDLVNRSSDLVLATVERWY
ncbi:hypothetical protein [Noviherbaspirillum aerium]|uniref:hypothetical protein n=1 Tax=Noviherbaspirillum aerium TaxID=2588497 RepID=UPI00124E600F|nr:hypothetical protein [Noviherbaspirillum aerium]